MICDTNAYESVEDTESDEDEEDFNDEEQPSPPIQHQLMKWWLQSQANQMHVPQFMGGDRSKKQNETLHIKKIQHLWAFSCCYFISFIDLLVTETNRILPPIFGQLWQNTKSISRCNKFQNVSVCSSHCTNGPQHTWQSQELLDKAEHFFTPFYPHYCDTRVFLAHLTLLALHR